ncbi:DnaJ C-terminal domain-containing protein [Paracoccus aerodenitrificans]|uniref:DnaJ C-terminal domain-containing protein n=1 Tax=Paracoccus aerodenitrificans TaxID=3017781 RepID=UPI0022EFF054|nr:DnaJ C-terminal domain-containing protein [Paracoccus aerodenitrificans]WBU62836.1 DnaJ domain-containing protein [Paracoccus aerodenitrificans]
MDDPYKALGVAKTASQDEIKKAYRRIAKTDHPDLNPAPEAAERFKAAAAAYDLLKDPEQRARFDAGEIDASGQERPQQQQYYRDFAERGESPYRQYSSAGYGDFSDVFEDLFGARAGARGAQGDFGGARPDFDGFRRSGSGRGFDMRGQDVRYDLDVDFMTAAKGGTTRITLPDGNTLDVKIPEGASDGQTIRLRGKGGEGYGSGGRGDAYLTLHLTDHPDWVRDGNDVTITLPISIDEAVLGGKVQVPTLDGAVSMTLPKGARTGQRLRLKGKGIKGGDQYVDLKIVMPPQVDDDLAAFMETWRKDHAYDPRKGMEG